MSEDEDVATEATNVSVLGEPKSCSGSVPQVSVSSSSEHGDAEQELENV